MNETSTDPEPQVMPTKPEDLPALMHRGVPIMFIGEDGEWVATPGHVDRAFLAAVVTDHNQPSEPYPPAFVEHRWMVHEFHPHLDSELRDQFRWEGVAADTEHAFPVSIVDTENGWWNDPDDGPAPITLPPSDAPALFGPQPDAGLERS